MSILEDSTLLYRVAKYYYLNGYGQSEIAKIESISRPQVSRLLQKARELGIVKIDVSLPDTLDIRQLKLKLQEVLQLATVVVSPSREDAKANDASLYSVAAAYLGEVLGNYRNVGIGWGKTMYHISLQLTTQEPHDELTFYPIVGNSSTSNPYLQTSSITDRFAEKFRAHVHYNNSLALTHREEMQETSKRRFEALKEHWRNLDVAVVGIGGRALQQTLYIEELPKGFYKEQDVSGIVGDILGNFYLGDKTLLQFPEEYVLVSMRLRDLKKIGNVIGVAHGPTKVDAILAASKQKLLNTLITDQLTAKLLLEHLQSKS